MDRAIDAGPHEPPATQVVEDRRVVALAPANDRGAEHDRVPLMGPEDLLHHGLGGPCLNRLVTARAVGRPRAREEDAQVVRDLGQRPDGRPASPRDRLLVHGDRRRQTLDELDLGLAEISKELPRIRGQGLEEPPLPLAEEGVEGEAALARAAHPSDHHQRVARKVDVHPLQVVLPRPADAQEGRARGGGHGGREGSSKGVRAASDPVDRSRAW